MLDFIPQTPSIFNSSHVERLWTAHSVKWSMMVFAWWCSIISLYSVVVVVEINRTDLTSRRSWRRSRRRCPAGNPGSATVHPGSAPCHRHHTGERRRSTKTHTHKWNISLVAPLNTLLLFRKMHDAFFIMHYYWLLTCYITTPKLRTASLNWCIFI